MGKVRVKFPEGIAADGLESALKIVNFNPQQIFCQCRIDPGGNLAKNRTIHPRPGGKTRTHSQISSAADIRNERPDGLKTHGQISIHVSQNVRLVCFAPCLPESATPSGNVRVPETNPRISRRQLPTD